MVGCPASDDPTDSETDSGPAYECDPVGDNPAMGELLNAPLDDTVEVIQKTPQHPGDPGPDGLP